MAAGFSGRPRIENSLPRLISSDKKDRFGGARSSSFLANNGYNIANLNQSNNLVNNRILEERQQTSNTNSDFEQDFSKLYVNK